MKNKIFSCSLLVFTLFAATPAFAVQYNITVLDFAGNFIRPLALNDHGKVVGSTNINGTSHAFLWEDGNVTLLDGMRVANDLNNLDQVVGQGQNDRAALWQAGSITDLGTLSGTYSHATSINNHGQIVGTSNIVSRAQATLWENGTPINLGSLNGSSKANAINHRGDAVGSSDDGWYTPLWSNGNITDLGSLYNDMSDAFDINDLGQVVGRSIHNRTLLDHATLWDNGNIISLGNVAGANDSIAFAINNIGQIVGYSQLFDILDDGLTVGTIFSFATLWQDDKLFKLDDLVVDLPLGWTLTEAQDINASGQIVGSGTTDSGQRFGFVLTPVPEPHTYALLALGLGMVGWAARKNSKHQMGSGHHTL